jgi:hypothetical protein
MYMYTDIFDITYSQQPTVPALHLHGLPGSWFRAQQATAAAVHVFGFCKASGHVNIKHIADATRLA